MKVVLILTAYASTSSSSVMARPTRSITHALGSRLARELYMLSFVHDSPTYIIPLLSLVNYTVFISAMKKIEKAVAILDISSFLRIFLA